jgi:hypothetical protein
MASANAAFEQAREDLDREAPVSSVSSRPAPSSVQPRAGSSPDLGKPSQVADPRELREALARRLTGGTARAPSLTKTSVPAPTVAYANPQDAMDALKRRYEDRRVDAAKAQAKKYRDAGDVAKSKNDPVSAASAYKIAASFLPEDAELQALAASSQKAADQILAENYLKQAHYEERSAHWPEAARSWAKVVKGRPNEPGFHDRLANAILHAEGDLHAAADAAKHAIELSPNSAPFRVTLVNVYVAAGLNIAARRELEAVLKAHPENAQALALMKRIQKGE